MRDSPSWVRLLILCQKHRQYVQCICLSVVVIVRDVFVFFQEEKEFPLEFFQDDQASSEEEVKSKETVEPDKIDNSEYDFPDTMLEVPTSISGLNGKKTDPSEV